MSYIKDTRAEMQHVAWPTQRQTVVYTTIVVLVSVLVALYIGMFDFAFTKVLEEVVVSGASPVRTVESTGTVTPIEGLQVQQEPVEGAQAQPQFNITPEVTPAQ